MLCTARQLCGFEVRAYDGKVGTVHDLYFDEEDWSVRFVVVSAGRWPFGRRVLICPEELGAHDKESKVLCLALTRAQLGQCPDAHMHKPLSLLRREEESTSRAWLTLWPWYAPAGACPVPLLALPPMDDALEEYGWGGEHPSMDSCEGDVSLRSMREVIGYRVQATDEDAGRVEDFLVCDNHWFVEYLLVETRSWWRGRKVVLEPEWIREFSCGEAKVYLKLARGGVEGVPQYDPDLYLGGDSGR
jgi:hypothetical protein